MPRGIPKRKRISRPYIKSESPEFLRILPAARRALDDAALGQNGLPKNRGGRPKKVKHAT